MESCGYLRAVEFLFDDFPNRPYYVITPMINVLIFYTHTHTHTQEIRLGVEQSNEFEWIDG